MLDKYSTLLQWLRGQRHFDFLRASAGDEYFFVVLSMTITGLVMLMRWNRLFPDRRDFANLAALPIPINNIFLANFVALGGLALVFAIDVNLVSCFFFPAFVTASDGRVSAFLNVGIAHVITVFSATLFSFFALFALVGMLTLLLPARWLRPVSVVRPHSAGGDSHGRVLLESFPAAVLRPFADICQRLSSMAARRIWFVGIYEAGGGNRNTI